MHSNCPHPSRSRSLALILLLVTTLLGACTAVRPYRYTIPAAPVSELPIKPLPCKAAIYLTEELEEPEDRYCRTFSVEKTADYTLFFIELDEQGRFYDRRQLEVLVSHLTSLRDLPSNDGQTCAKSARESGDASIVTFVHGWRHNAQYDDANVKSARQQLVGAAAAERDATFENCERQVIGVYVGWRGLSSVSGPLHNEQSNGTLLERVLSVWELITVADRKNTAKNMAVGSARELFGLLRAFQEYRNTPERRAERCSVQPSQAADPSYCKSVRLAIIGHSFGGLIVYNAVAGQIIDSVVRGTFAQKFANNDPCDASTANKVGSALVSSYADLILLINPAFEGARYEALHGAVNARAKLPDGHPASFCPNQRPVLVSVTATGDSATGTYFPFVRVFNTLFESSRPQNPNFDVHPEAQSFVHSEEAAASANTVGHVQRYITHTMAMSPRTAENPLHAVPRLTFIEGYAPSNTFAFHERTSQLEVRNSKNSPVWNISITDGEIIPDHSSITKPSFLCFVSTLYKEQVAHPSDHGKQTYQSVNRAMEKALAEKREPCWKNVQGS